VSGRVSSQRINEIVSLHFHHDQSSSEFVYDKLCCTYTASCIDVGPVELSQDRAFGLWAKLTVTNSYTSHWLSNFTNYYYTTSFNAYATHL
jgi:hypothetical protein